MSMEAGGWMTGLGLPPPQFFQVDGWVLRTAALFGGDNFGGDKFGRTEPPDNLPGGDNFPEGRYDYSGWAMGLLPGPFI